MPVYQYRGIECDHVFEARQSFSDDALTDCDVCGKPVRRVIHASPIVFKGTGWYLTDSRPTSDPVGGVQDADKASSSDKDSTQSTAKSEKTEKSESKPAAKSESAPVTASAD